jgi:hypothetical protein
VGVEIGPGGVGGRGAVDCDRLRRGDLRPAVGQPRRDEPGRKTDLDVSGRRGAKMGRQVVDPRPFTRRPGPIGRLGRDACLREMLGGVVQDASGRICQGAALVVDQTSRGRRGGVEHPVGVLGVLPGAMSGREVAPHLTQHGGLEVPGRRPERLLATVERAAGARLQIGRPVERVRRELSGLEGVVHLGAAPFRHDIAEIAVGRLEVQRHVPKSPNGRHRDDGVAHADPRLEPHASAPAAIHR